MGVIAIFSCRKSLFKYKHCVLKNYNTKGDIMVDSIGPNGKFEVLGKKKHIKYEVQVNDSNSVNIGRMLANPRIATPEVLEEARVQNKKLIDNGHFQLSENQYKDLIKDYNDNLLAAEERGRRGSYPVGSAEPVEPETVGPYYPTEEIPDRYY